LLRRAIKENTFDDGEVVSTSLKNLVLSEVNGDNSNIICVSGSEVKEIHNVSISHSNNFGLLIKDTTVDSVSQLKMLNTTQCFQASKSSIVNLVDSEFES